MRTESEVRTQRVSSSPSGGQGRSKDLTGRPLALRGCPSSCSAACSNKKRARCRSVTPSAPRPAGHAANLPPSPVLSSSPCSISDWLACSRDSSMLAPSEACSVIAGAMRALLTGCCDTSHSSRSVAGLVSRSHTLHGLGFGMLGKRVSGASASSPPPLVSDSN
eukprot:7243092-Prymnesium_polylepis.1